MQFALRSLRALVSRLKAGKPCRPADPPLREGGIVLAALMTEAVRQREAEGRTTSLRQLHLILGVSQPTALRVAHLLASEGVVRIEENLNDRFASRLHLTPETRNRFLSLRYENIAEKVA